ncbi:MAG: efflux RND transporter periplasmic adaptor subunit [Rhodobacteraceae bacterium]|nr:efflux RND transporter periplasmic adaptor subunit [Paracoccaceae bacterium]
MRNGLKLVLITLPLVAIGAGILAYIVKTSPPPERKPLAERASVVRAIVAESQPIAPQIVGFGLVSPARTYEAIAQVGGSIEWVNPDLEKGAILPAGSELLRLSPADFNLAIAQARANIRAAEARLAELAVSQENQVAALAIENEALALKTNDLERAETLFAGGTVSQSALDAARSGHLAQRQKVLAIESTLALMPTQREVQLEQISQYQASLETATLNLERTVLTLPFTARAASVSVETGQYVRVGEVTAILDGIAMAEVEAQVSISDMQRLLLSVRPDAGTLAADPTLMTEVLRGLELPSQVNLRLADQVISWAANVNRISDVIDPKTGTLGVIVQVDTAYTRVEPGQRPPLTKGMFVEVVLSAPPMQGIVVPRNALRDGQLLIADADNRLRLIAVTAHLVQEAVVLIRDGIEEGTRVIVSDPSPVIPGMLLDVTLDEEIMAELAAKGPAR